MLKKILLSLFSVLLFSNINIYAKDKIIIKYSARECAYCNMQLYSLMTKKINAPVDIILKHEEQDNPAIDNLINNFGKQFKIIYSDSLYYANDSSERSMIFVINTDKNIIVYSNYLKTFNVDSLITILPSDSQENPGHILFSRLMNVCQSDSFLYMYGAYNYILKIAKNKLDDVYDTIFINDKNFRPEIYKKLYGGNYEKELDSFKAVSKRYAVPDIFKINDFDVEGDTIYILAATNVLQKSNDDYTVMNKAFLLTYVNKKWVSAWVMDISPYNENDNERYMLNNHFFLHYKNAFYMSVTKDTLSTDNYSFAKCKIDSNKMKIDKLIEYNLPNHIIQEKIGYMMNNDVHSNNIINNVYSNQFYDIANKKTFQLNIEKKQNDFSKADVMSLRFKTNFKVICLGYYHDNLSIIYKNADSLVNAHYAYSKNKLTFLNEKILSAPFPNKEKFANNGIVCDAKGIYTYSYAYNKFYYFPYE